MLCCLVVEQFGEADLLSPAIAEDKRVGAVFGIGQNTGTQETDISIEIRLRRCVELEDVFAGAGKRTK